MYRSNGNFEAYARPPKPEGVDGKKAYFVGAGLASLAGAAFLIRDAQLSGENIIIFEELALPGGSMDGILDEHKGFIVRGGREMEAHFETLWDLFRSIPSLDTPDASVLDEMYWLHKKDPSRNPCRATEGRGDPIPHMADLTLTPKAVEEMLKLALTPESALDDKRIDECFGEEFFASNFWLYWATMFAFEPWASAMEMRRYMLRFVHHIATLADLSSLRFTRYNQYESLIMPLVAWLEGKGVRFQYDTQVENIEVETAGGNKLARRLVMTVGGEPKTIELTENGAWTLWKNLAAQHPAFGRPEKFCEDIPDANWTISATVTLLDDKIVPWIEKMTGRDPRDGRIVTGGPCNFKDSNWLYGYTMSRQPHFKAQDESQKLVVWLYGLFSDKPGNYVKKKIRECAGAELCEEWLFHMGVPVEDIPALARRSASTIPCNMPYITSYFMPRAMGDRPLVVPDGSKNLAFIGNFAETEKDTVFTTEYSVRTAMEAVYTLFNVDRGVPEVFASSFDVRVLMSSLYYLNDRKKLDEIQLPFVARLLGKVAMKKIEGTYLEELLKDAKLV